MGPEDPGSPSSWPGLVSSHAPSTTGPGFGSLYLGYHARPEKGHVWGSSLPEAAFLSGCEGCWLHSGR